jgi:hypothetical protein
MPIEYEESWKEKLTSMVPVYGELKKKGRRKKMDKEVREKALTFLDHSRDGVDQLNKTLSQQGEDEFLQEVEDLRTKIDVVKRKMDNTKYGHSSVFEMDEPSSDRIEKIVEYDAKIIVKSKNFQKHVEELTDKSIGNEVELEDIQGLLREVDILKKDWERRKDVIMGVDDIEEQIDYS